MSQIVLGPNRAYPAIPTIGDTLESHSRALEAMREGIQIHERRTSDTLESFVRVSELIDLGLISVDGNIIVDASEESTTHVHDTLYLRLDGTNDPVTGAVVFSGGITVPSGDVGVTGNITVSGNVDGRDVSADGATLDAHVALVNEHIDWSLASQGTIHATNYVGGGTTDHTLLTNIGTNTHAQIDTHIADGTIHFTEASIDHTAIINIGTNTHAQIDTHIADGTIHFTEASIDHTAILNIGTNTHAQIDTHIALVNEHIDWSVTGGQDIHPDRLNQVDDGLGTPRPVGMDVMPIYEIDVADTFDNAHRSMMWHKDAGAAISFTCANDSGIPQGAMWVVHNDDTEDVTIAQSGTTVYWLEAGAAPAAGNVTLKQGAIVTVYKYSNTEYWVWGAKDAPAASPSLDSLTDTTITTPADAALLLYDTGTAMWRDATMSGDATITDTGSITVSDSAALNGQAAAYYGALSESETVTGFWDFENNTGVRISNTTGTDYITLAPGTTAFTMTGTSMVNFNVAGFTRFRLQGGMTFSIAESASAQADVASYGQIWIKNNVPNDLYYTADNGVDYPVAYATYRRSSANVIDNINQSLNMTTDSVADAMVNGAWIKTNTTAYTLTLEPSTDTQFPVGSQIAIYNRGASGLMTVTEGTGTTLYVLDGSASTDAAGSATIAAGGYATLIRESTTIYVLMGAGVTP